MHRLRAFLFLTNITIAAAFGQENVVGTSTFTLGTGGAWTLGGRPFNYSGGPAVNGTYEYRIWKYFAVEAGIHNTHLSITDYSSIYTPTLINPGLGLYQYNSSSLVTRGSARDTTALFGFRGILPLRKGKAETFAAGDAAYTWNAGQGYRGVGAEFRLGARVAIDRQRHVWIGTSGEYQHELGLYPQHWLKWTADIGYRFGK
jgi:hypothetical protein